MEYGDTTTLDGAMRQDMESFATFDAEAFRAIHTEDAVTIFANGRTMYGVDEIMKALDAHFTNRNATWTYTELRRVVVEGKSAFVLYDATYAIPSEGRSQRALVGVTYTWTGERWLVIADQSTLFAG